MKNIHTHLTTYTYFIVKYMIMLCIFILGGCQHEDLFTAFEKGQQVTLRANMPTSDAPQRIRPVDVGSRIDLLWVENDEIEVIVDGQIAIFTLSSGAGTSQGEFTGTMPAEGTEYDVQYPVGYSDELLKVQNYVEYAWEGHLMHMRTHTRGNIDQGFTLHAENAIITLNLTGNSPISKIVVTNNTDQSKYTLLCSGIALRSVPQEFNIVIPAGNWGRGFNVAVYDQYGAVISTLNSDNAVQMTAGIALEMPVANIQYTENQIPQGLFSISRYTKVRFSPGNLQYNTITRNWRFAAHAWEHVGAEQINSSEPNGIIDLFGWSAENSTAPWGVSFSTNENDYNGNFIDWGKNAIQFGATLFPANTWYTLSKSEWDYLLNTRDYANSKFGAARINGINGYILLPDYWVQPKECTFKPGCASSSGLPYYQTVNNYTLSQWEAMEKAGAVFLPAVGYRHGTDITDVDVSGRYWTSTAINNDAAQVLVFRSNEIYTNLSYGRSYARSIRLVQRFIEE